MLRAVRLTVMPEAAEIVAGSVLSLSLTVQNVGGRTDRYLLDRTLRCSYMLDNKNGTGRGLTTERPCGIL